MKTLFPTQELNEEDFLVPKANPKQSLLFIMSWDYDTVLLVLLSNQETQKFILKTQVSLLALVILVVLVLSSKFF